MTEVEFPKPPRPSSSTWSLGSNQYAPGKFPKVSISVPAVRLSQENKINPGASLQNDPINRLSQEPKQWVTPRSQNPNQNPKIPNSNPNPNLNPNPNPNPKESVLGKRKEPVQETGTNTTVGLRMKLLEILNASSQKEPTDSPQIQNQNSQKEGETLKNPNLDQTEKVSAIKLSPNQNKGEKGKLDKENNPFSDPIETDSDSSKRVEARPVTRSLSLKKNSTFLNKGTSGGSKRAKVEPKKLNFSKKPPVSGKNAKKPFYNENEPQKTPSHNTRDTMKTSSNKTNNNNHNNNNNTEKENSWDFPVTPVISNSEQEKEVSSPKFGRNRRVFGDLKDSFANITNSGASLQKRKSVAKPAQQEDTRVSSGLQGSSAIKTNTGASKQKPSAIPTSVKPKLNKPVNKLVDSPVISEDIMQVDPTSALNAGLSSLQMKKPVVNNKLVESPVTSEDIMQVDKEAGSKGSFVNRKNSGGFMQRNNSESPVTSEDVQSEKEAERENEMKGSFANKINPGGNLQNENWADVERNKSVAGGSKGSFVNKINSGGFMQRNNSESPVTSEDVQPEKEPERKNDISKGSFADKINPGVSLQKEKLLESPVTSNGDYDYHKSPTFAMNGTSSSKKGFDEEISVPVRNHNFSNHNFPNPKISNPKSSESSQCSSDSDPDYELSEDTRDSNDLIRKKVPNASPIEDLETQSIGINSFLNKGYRRTDNLFSDLDMPIKSPPIIKSKFGGKLVKEHEKREDLYPETPIGTDEENNGSEEMVNQFPENDLASAVCQLAAVLKRFKAKIKTNTNKKSAEILSLTAEKIQEQLKDAQVQMQEDIRKFMGCSNSKRKQLELKFQEQAEKLKMIHDKFREEINQQLIECKSSFEEFEAYQMELKGVAEKQKVIHRKLLGHVEEETKTQLSDAEKKISLVHREAHKKMSGLKRVLKQWIPEGAD